MSKAAFKRILLKLSGEALAGDQAGGINSRVINEIAEGIKATYELKTEIGMSIKGSGECSWRSVSPIVPKAHL